jgi:ketosteroid isomerase-like protein
MSAERCIRFMSDLESRDLKRVRNWFAQDAVLWMPPTEPIEGSTRIAAMFRVIYGMYAELHWKVTAVHAIGESRFVYETESWGTIGKDTPYKNYILSIIEFDANDRISYLSDYFKDTAIFNAGRFSSPASSSPARLQA